MFKKQNCCDMLKHIYKSEYEGQYIRRWSNAKKLSDDPKINTKSRYSFGKER